jgi:hypothetical protein
MVTRDGTDRSVAVKNASKPPRLKVRGLYGSAPRLVNASECAATGAAAIIGGAQTLSAKLGRWSIFSSATGGARVPIVIDQPKL